jgi:hypothetical protein
MALNCRAVRSALFPLLGVFLPRRLIAVAAEFGPVTALAPLNWVVSQFEIHRFTGRRQTRWPLALFSATR